MVPVPMVRIRDICHSKFVPRDLKKEIKHQLQNKLHRCAEPSDLQTCERILQKVMTREDCNQEFRSQMTIFHEELKEFFNAQGLDKLLHQIKEGMNSPILSNQILAFEYQKQNVEARKFSLESITTLRNSL